MQGPHAIFATARRILFEQTIPGPLLHAAGSQNRRIVAELAISRSAAAISDLEQWTMPARKSSMGVLSPRWCLSSGFRHCWCTGSRESHGPQPDRADCGTGANLPSVQRISTTLGDRPIAESEPARRELGGRLQQPSRIPPPFVTQEN